MQHRGRWHHAGILKDHLLELHAIWRRSLAQQQRQLDQSWRVLLQLEPVQQGLQLPSSTLLMTAPAKLQNTPCSRWTSVRAVPAPGSSSFSRLTNVVQPGACHWTQLYHCMWQQPVRRHRPGLLCIAARTASCSPYLCSLTGRPRAPPHLLLLLRSMSSNRLLPGT
jgi:hypothetical protein